MAYGNDGDRPWWAPLMDVRALWAAIAVIGVLSLMANVGAWFEDDEGASGDRTQPLNASPSPTGYTDGGAGESAAPGTGQQPTAGQADGSSASNRQATLDGCEGRWTAQGRPLLAAQASMEQWRLHITAMNRLVAGEITIAQAADFWQQTRVGAINRVQRFHTDYARYTRDAPACPSSGLTAADSSPTSGSLERCVAAARAGDRILTLADTAVTTWEHHVHDMEMLRKGEITPAQAADKWRTSWRAGNRQLKKFQDALHRGGTLRCS